MRSSIPFHAMPRPIRDLTVYSLVMEAETSTLAEDDDPSAPLSSGEEFQYPTAARWGGTIGMEGEVTGDGRLIELSALRWDISPENPSSFRNVLQDVGAHANAVTVGTLDTVERREGGIIWGEGDYDMGSEAGREAYRLCKLGLQTGVSMDLDDVSFEIRVAKDLMESEGEDDKLVASNTATLEEDATREHETVVEMRSDDELMVTTDARVRTATQVAVPAFESARIGILSEVWPDATAEEDGATVVRSTNSVQPELALVAAAVPVDPPRGWFFRDEADGPTPLTVTDDGEVYGHIATWDVCHVASPAGEGICVLAPRSATNYAKFHVGTLKTAEGDIIDVGKLTMGTGHAGPRLTPHEAASHYDHTGTAAADVRAIDGRHGIWVSGALRPTMTAAKVRALRASPISGDWRKVNGNLELHAALAVNVPGFPIPRVNGLVASGELNSLVAAGMLAPRKVMRRSEDGTQLSESDLTYLRRLAAKARADHSLELKQRVELTRQKMKVRAFAAGRK